MASTFSPSTAERTASSACRLACTSEMTATRIVRGATIAVGAAVCDEIVVPDQAELCALAYKVATLVRTRPVAHGIAEAPDGIDVLAVDRGEDGVERVPVSVHVRDDGDSHRSRRDHSRRRRGLG